MKNFDVKGYVSKLSDEELVGEVLSWEFSANTTNEELLKAVKKNKIPTIFIHGEKDFVVPTEMGKELFENAIAEKKLVLFENASHANNALTDFELYEKEVVAFISKYVKNVLN